MKVFFETSEEWKAYYDYWCALLTLANKRNMDKLIILDRGLMEANECKAKYRLNELLSRQNIKNS